MTTTSTVGEKDVFGIDEAYVTISHKVKFQELARLSLPSLPHGIIEIKR